MLYPFPQLSKSTPKINYPDRSCLVTDNYINSQTKWEHIISRTATHCMIYTWSPGRVKHSFTVPEYKLAVAKISYSVAHVKLFFLSISQTGRTNEFDSKQLLSGNYPGIMYHHVITPDKIQSLWKIICTVCLISKPFRCLNLWEKNT